MLDIADLLIYTLESRASDLHLTVDLPPSVRVHGEVEQIPNYPPLTKDNTRDLVYSIMNDRQRAKFEDFNDLDFSLDFGERGRFRVNAFQGRQGVGSVLRVIPNEIKSIEDLGMPIVINKLAEYERGLVLVTAIRSPPWGHEEIRTEVPSRPYWLWEQHSRCFQSQDPSR